MGDFYDWSDVPLPPNFMEEFLSSLEPMPNVNQTFNYIPTSSSYHHQPPVLQHPHLVMPIETFGPASAPDSVPAWSASSNDTEASHSRIVSSVNTPSSTHSIPEQKKRKYREGSSCSDSANDLSHPKKSAKRSPTAADREKTNLVRGDKACLPCQLEKRGCTPKNPHDPLSPCDRCYKRLSTLSRLVLCCRVNITDLEIFRYGPTQQHAQTLRYLIVTGTPQSTKYKQIKKLADSPRRNVTSSVNYVRLSQGYSDTTLNLKVQKFDPKDTDKVNYTWVNGNEVETYKCSHYALADLEHVQISLENFLENNTEMYVNSVLSNASPMTKKVFETSLAFSKESKLVKLALRFWVASRFIETPWHIIADEFFGMKPDTRPGSPYFGLIPDTPMMDNQLDNIVIYHLLEPEWKKLRKIVRTKLLEHKKQDWFELQLTLFILLSHVEMTVAHDIAFSTRHSLPTTFSNPPLIEKMTHAAETLLKYFHNPGLNMYYPVHGKWATVEADYGWADDHLADQHEAHRIQIQKQYVLAIRSMLAQQREYSQARAPGQELFWTGQLWRDNWTPVAVNAYA